MPDDVPLATIKSRGSSTGARRSDQVNVQEALSDSDSSDSDEKHHGRRKALVRSRRGTGGTEEVSVNWLGLLYAKVIGFNASLRYIIYIVPVALALAAPLIILVFTGHKHDLPVGSNTKTRKTKDGDDEEFTVLGPPLFDIFLWVEIAWLTVWAGKLVAYFLPPTFMFLCGVISSGTRKYSTILKNLTIPVSLFFWALASWISFHNLFKRTRSDGVTWVVNLERVLGATFASSAVYLGEKAFIQLIGISYHQRSFTKRIRASKENIRLLSRLYDASRSLFPMYCHEFEEEDFIINNSIDVRAPGQKAKPGPAGVPLRLAGNVGRLGDRFASIVGNIASEISGKQVLKPNSARSIVTEALEKTASSEALGRRIWMSFVVEGSENLLPEDISEVLGPTYAEDARNAFTILDEDENGDISLDEMVRKVVSIGKERKGITEGMKDISQALQAFDKVLLFLVLLIVIFIFLAFFQSSFITTLATAGTALLSLSFVFAVSTQEILGSCIFLFVKHPYDVGDRVSMLVDGQKVSLLVERISLLYSVFVRTDMMQLVQMPNIKLNDIWIENVTRSGSMFQVFTINVSYDYTTSEDINRLRHELEKFVRHPDNSRDFEPNIYLWIVGLGDLDKMELQMLIWHRSNWHDGILTGDRNSKFIGAVADALRRIPIYAPRRGDFLGTATNPAYMVSFSENAAAEKHTEMDKHREAFRTIPTDPPVGYPHGPAATSAAAAAAPTGFTGAPPAGNDWSMGADKPTPAPAPAPLATMPENTRLAHDPHPTGAPAPQRGESQSKGGLRKRGETITNSVPREGGVAPQASPSLRSQRAYDEEEQVGSTTAAAPTQGGFLAPSASQRSAPPPAQEQQGADPSQRHLAPQLSRRGPRREPRNDGLPHPPYEAGPE